MVWLADLLTKHGLIAGLGMLEPRALCNWIKFLERLLRLFFNEFSLVILHHGFRPLRKLTEAGYLRVTRAAILTCKAEHVVGHP